MLKIEEKGSKGDSLPKELSMGHVFETECKLLPKRCNLNDSKCICNQAPCANVMDD